MPDNAKAKRPDSPWHEGELAIQRSLGVVERMDATGRNFVRTFMPEQHQQFFPMLPFALFGTVDAKGDVWATMRAAAPGFMHAPDALNLTVRLPREPDDPADAGMDDAHAIGMLGIQLETRRRNRLNGAIRRDGDDGFTIRVRQSFGNCPQYIQLRQFAFTRDPHQPAPVRPVHRSALDDRARAIIAHADTFFVASYVDLDTGERQVDVSHRGGKAGFVEIGEDGVLTIPDFSGNLFFNTLGNFMVNPRAGLLFVDFATGDMLQMTGSAEVILSSPEVAAFQGAERLWRFRPEQVVYREDGLPLRFAFEDGGWSPSLLPTGDWEQARIRLQAAALADTWRPFRVARTEEESATIRSLYLEPDDGVGLMAHRAGQHLPIRLTAEAGGKPLVRSYTLSSAPTDGFYRISVKLDGAASQYLHGLKAGDRIEARAPAGSFTIDGTERRPAVLIGAGVGITPVIAMLKHITAEGRRKRRLRPTWLFQAARSLEERAFDREIAALVEEGQGNIRLVRALSQPETASEGQDYDIAGRIDISHLKATLPFDDYDFYLCGPAAFTQSLYDGLRALSIADARIHAEAFGLSSLTRRPDGGSAPAIAAPASAPVHIVFAKSAKEARWQPGEGSLLDLAEARGLAPDFGCRNGSCGTCRTPLLEGKVTYPSQPSYPVSEGEALICCAVPAESEERKLHLSL
ncbi:MULTISPECIES: pyridoxamine 5'-phosphate oxidase family protein [unclassified Ensifer]|uniref:FAD-binding oxidoreductase n=1 Tax=unclassified Ensifer TaxID=2633371 RepID=UPI000813C503|nr:MULTISPECIES: pyridoxamine 5'-phosphate oxidase family protein [unclassified Ensifer]OCP00479.1 FAD-binding oxidoreductase [Ensifer sp. LC14]OCP05850.1 FAD-binding oxidoreductase [Ensifer sp. LC11]OCP06598.1 FAD-binding oxidoreductase [Ensifer sp. LC13]OCP31162.1 FAD-binding oxidoreductase [Ensifer sp. LC499]